MMADSSSSTWTIESRPAALKCSIDSRRCFICFDSTSITSSSVRSRPSSIRRFWKAAMAMRSVPVRRTSRASMASRMADSIRSWRVIGLELAGAGWFIGSDRLTGPAAEGASGDYARVALRFLASLRFRFTLGFS